MSHVQFFYEMSFMELTTKSGKLIIFRDLQSTDTAAMLAYINTLSQEDTCITFSGETISFEQEQSYVDRMLQGMYTGDSVCILAWHQNELAGIANIERQKSGLRRSAHRGSFGISIAQAYRKDGIGVALAQETLRQSAARIKNLRIIELNVYGNNDPAISLYHKLGFIEFGRLPKGVWYRGNYFDLIYMYKEICK
jgi:RimJ/RimL family protein N-acetyltransferase